MRTNARMRRLLSAIPTEARQLHPTLLAIAEKKFVRLGDCIVFEGERDNRNEFFDKTAYECASNHIHIDDLLRETTPEAHVAQAFLLAALLNTRLGAMAPDTTFRFVIAVHDDGGCTFRFHAVRSNEIGWTTADLEHYGEEAVAEIESGDLSSPPPHLARFVSSA